MPRLRLRFVLPALQLVIAIILSHLAQLQVAAVRGLYDTVYAPTAILALDGINAPTFIPVVIMRNLAQFVPDTWIGRQLFFVGHVSCILALWYLVGRELDDIKASQLAGLKKTHGMLWKISLLCMGVFLASFSFMNFAHLQDLRRWNNFVGNVTEGLLYWSWSLILLTISGRGIILDIRTRLTAVR